MKCYYVIIIIISFLFSCKQKHDKNLIKNISEFNTAISNANLGNTIALAKDDCKDTELIFEGKETKENPIMLTVEETRTVTLEGGSNLQIAGEYLVVDGLVFKNGFTATSALVSYRKNKDEVYTKS